MLMFKFAGSKQSFGIYKKKKIYVFWYYSDTENDFFCIVTFQAM